MDGNSYFHVGLVVEKIGPALEQLTELAGYTWQTPMTVPVAVRDAEGAEYTVEITMVYSNQAPYLEVIEGIPGTPWAHDPNGSNLHHLGFAVEDPAAAGARWRWDRLATMASSRPRSVITEAWGSVSRWCKRSPQPP